MKVRGRERAASLVEYTLLVAILAVGTLGGLQAIAGGAEQATARTAGAISHRTVPTVPADGSTTTVAPPATTTTMPPTTTTAPPATTTTAKPTTTTTTPPTTTTTTTTTTTPATTATAKWGSASAQKSGNQWRALATLTVSDSKSKPVSGAQVRVGVQYSQGGTWHDAPDLTAVTSSNGQINVDSGLYARAGNPSSRVDQIRFVVKSVVAPGLTYTSGAVSTTLDKP